MPLFSALIGAEEADDDCRTIRLGIDAQDLHLKKAMYAGTGARRWWRMKTVWRSTHDYRQRQRRQHRLAASCCWNTHWRRREVASWFSGGSGWPVETVKRRDGGGNERQTGDCRYAMTLRLLFAVYLSLRLRLAGLSLAGAGCGQQALPLDNELSSACDTPVTACWYWLIVKNAISCHSRSFSLAADRKIVWRYHLHCFGFYYVL